MSHSDLPIIRLKPKANARAIRHGAPWVFDNEIVTDRRTKSLQPGVLARLEDADRSPVALVAVNPGSKIFARVMERGAAADLVSELDANWFEARIKRAHDMRARLFETSFYRLIHAEADGMPGVIIDRFGDIAVLQPNAAWADSRVDLIADALVKVAGVTTVLKNAGGRTRALEGLDDTSAVLRGEMPDGPVPVVMNGATYMADLNEGQKTGLFYDQRPNHAFGARLSQGARVLDVFSHVGGFGLAALAGGATSVLALDSSAPALALATDGAAAMGKAAQFETRQADAFDGLAALTGENAQFDVVICDPPAFAPNKQALDAGIRAYERIARMASGLVAPGGYLGLCSCSHAADLTRFRQACHRGIGRAGREGALIYTGFAGPDHPMHPNLAESGYLKALFYRL